MFAFHPPRIRPRAGIAVLAALAGYPRASGAQTLGDHIQIPFISVSERQPAPAILKKVVGMSILTVSDIDAFCGMGGIIHVSKQDQRIRFEVNLGVGQRSGLTISSRLLGLARLVHSERADS